MKIIPVFVENHLLTIRELKISCKIYVPGWAFWCMGWSRLRQDLDSLIDRRFGGRALVRNIEVKPQPYRLKHPPGTPKPGRDRSVELLDNV